MKSILFSTSLLMMSRIGVNGQCSDGIVKFTNSQIMPIGICNLLGEEGSMKMTCDSLGDQVFQTMYSSQDCSGSALMDPMEVTAFVESFDCSAQTDCNYITVHQWEIADTETCGSYTDALSNNLVSSVSLTLMDYNGYLNNCADIDSDGTYEVLSLSADDACNEGYTGSILTAERFGFDSTCQDSSSLGSETYFDGTDGSQPVNGTITCTYVPADACTDSDALSSAVWDQELWELFNPISYTTCYDGENMQVNSSDIITCSADEDACSFRVKFGQEYWRRGCASSSSCDIGCDSWTETDSNNNHTYNVTACCCTGDNCNSYELLAWNGVNITLSNGDNDNDTDDDSSTDDDVSADQDGEDEGDEGDDDDSAENDGSVDEDDEDDREDDGSVDDDGRDRRDEDEDDDEDSDDNGSSASTTAYSLAALLVASYYIIIA